VRVAIAAAVVLLSGCATDRVAFKPAEPIIVDRYIFVSIDKTLTQPEEIASGPLSQCPKVAAERKAAVESCNAKLKAISEIEGTDAQ
jgi:hypothetical protein